MLLRYTGTVLLAAFIAVGSTHLLYYGIRGNWLSGSSPDTPRIPNLADIGIWTTLVFNLIKFSLEWVGVSVFKFLG